MKRLITAILLPLLLTIATPTHGVEEFDITLKSKWHDLESNEKKSTDFGGKWILVGSITFKKRCKDPIFIKTINLHWNGEHIDNLIGSLYKKALDEEFLAIEDNLVCDGIWSNSKQTLILDFDEKENLGPTTVFYLVLTVPESIEPILKKGSFCIEEQCLPKPFKQCIQQEKLTLAINDTATKSSDLHKTH